ncbi:hypothetical protein CV093_05285 [Oceanobacillus sp. 143]|nr:hypothetical protein CV093_05285 [Oceanobacillus sp. 143]
MLGNQERKFKKFILHMNVSMNLFFLLSFGALCSLAVFSLELFLLFIFISFVELAFAWCWWKNGMDMVRFKEVMTILAILNIGFYSVMPLIFLPMVQLFF